MRICTAIIALASLYLSGCGAEERVPLPHESTATTGGTLVVGAETDADALTPLTATSTTGNDIYSLLFCGLAKTNPDMATYSPWLANSWEFSDDHKSITFDLRRDVSWHDGARFTAADVEYSFPLYKEGRNGFGAIRWLDKIVAVTAIDSFTVRYDFDSVYPYQLTDACVAWPLPRHILETIPREELANHDFHRAPIGNGPFRFESWTTQQSVVVVANKDYFEGAPGLERVVFKIVPSRTNLLAQVETGEVDFYPRFPPQAWDDLSGNSRLRLLRIPSRVYYYLGWQNAHPLFRSRDVRRALTMAIDRESIVRSLLYGSGQVIHGPILPFLWAHEPNVSKIPYDPDGAKKLLAEEGWSDSDGDGWLDKDGVRFEFTMKTNENNDLRKDIVVIVQDMLAKIGIKVHAETVEYSVYMQQATGKEFEAICFGWRQGVKVDLTSIWHSRSIEDKFNMVSYANEEVDRLIDSAVLELDRGDAKSLWSGVQQEIAADAPYTFLFNIDDLYAIDRRFEDVEIITYGWASGVSRWRVPPENRKY